MKKLLCLIILSLTVALGCNLITVLAAEDISVVLNGNTLEFDVPPQLIDNRTMVPLRVIFEAMGASVDWDDDTRTVTATKGNERVIATVDSRNVYISGDTKTLDVPPMIVNDRTLVPVRFVAEAFGADVEWIETTKIVNITEKWDRTGDIPYYKSYPTIPDFGIITGVSNTGSETLGTNLYKKSSISDSDFNYYLSLMKSLGFTVRIGDDLYSCNKDGTYVDITTLDDKYAVFVTPADSQPTSAPATQQTEQAKDENTVAQDTSSFKKLKNDIMSKGLYIESDNMYMYVYKDSSGKYKSNTYIYYMIDDDEIRILHEHESLSGDGATETSLYLYNNDSAAVVFTTTDKNGNKENYAGHYSGGTLIQDYSDVREEDLSIIQKLLYSTEVSINGVLELKGFPVNLSDFDIPVV